MAFEEGTAAYGAQTECDEQLGPAVRACIGGAMYDDLGVCFYGIRSDVVLAADVLALGDGEPLTSIEEDVLRLFASALSALRVGEQLGLDREQVSRVKGEAIRCERRARHAVAGDDLRAIARDGVARLRRDVVAKIVQRGLCGHKTLKRRDLNEQLNIMPRK